MGLGQIFNLVRAMECFWNVTPYRYIHIIHTHITHETFKALTCIHLLETWERTKNSGVEKDLKEMEEKCDKNYLECMEMRIKATFAS